jgi:hypothetical protein
MTALQLCSHTRLTLQPLIFVAGTHLTARPSERCAEASAQDAATTVRSGTNLEAPCSSADPGTAAADAGIGRCPFLGAMLPPVSSRVPWYKRMLQMSDPRSYQQQVLGGEAIVQVG